MMQDNLLLSLGYGSSRFGLISGVVWCVVCVKKWANFVSQIDTLTKTNYTQYESLL